MLWEAWHLEVRAGDARETVGVLPRRPRNIAANTVREFGETLLEPEAVQQVRLRWRPDLNRTSRLQDPDGDLWSVVGLEEVGRRKFIDLLVARFAFAPVGGVDPSAYVAPPGWQLRDANGAPVLKLEIGAFSGEINGVFGSRLAAGHDVTDRYGVHFLAPAGGWSLAAEWTFPLNQWTFLPDPEADQRGMFPAYLETDLRTEPVVGTAGVPWSTLGLVFATRRNVWGDDAAASIANWNDAENIKAGALWPGIYRDRDAIVSDQEADPAYYGMVPLTSSLTIDRDIIEALSVGDVLLINQGPFV
ncbi:MAG: hypothetical protein OXI45_13675 [Acidobacteriota bacterium]|nr:hypothetical protein [Acidobacteriota bacterium]